MSKKKILITGGCGFIGTNLIEALKDKEYPLRILDNLSVGKKEDLKKITSFKEYSSNISTQKNNETELIIGDVEDYETCLQSCADCSVVIHLAANTGVNDSVKDPIKDMEKNILGTLNLLEASRLKGVKRFIFASSGATIGDVVPPIHEELVPHPISPYGASKLSGEAYCSVYYHTFGIHTIALRFSNVYGPRSQRKNSVVAKFIKQALKGETIEIYGDGNQTRDFLYVQDLCEAIYKAIEINKNVDFPWGEVFQIATNKETSINDLLDRMLINLSEHKIKDIKSKKTTPRKGDILKNYSDIKKAQKYLNWSPEHSLKQGLDKTFP